MNEEVNIFSELQEIPGVKPKGYVNIYKKNYHYRKAENKEISCKTCDNLIKVKYTKFYKCKNIGISSSQATDIHLKNVCDLYKQEG